jgi:uncharacterized protein YndB with AHSA1/START domain
MSTVKVQVIRRFDFSAERVFDAFLDPQKAKRFMFATETGEMIKAELQPWIGGSFVFVDKRPNGNAEHYGTYLEIERPRRLKFQFAVQKDALEQDPVTIELKPRGKGCELTLTHEMGAQHAKLKERVIEGWTGILGGLADALLEGP